jgi:hypothetical protein
MSEADNGLVLELTGSAVRASNGGDNVGSHPTPPNKASTTPHHQHHHHHQQQQQQQQIDNQNHCAHHRRLCNASFSVIPPRDITSTKASAVDPSFSYPYGFGHPTTTTAAHARRRSQFPAFRQDVNSISADVDRRQFQTVALFCDGRSCLDDSTSVISARSGGGGDRSRDISASGQPPVNGRRQRTTDATSSSSFSGGANRKSVDEIAAVARRHIWSCHVPGSVKRSSRAVSGRDELLGALTSSPPPTSVGGLSVHCRNGSGVGDDDKAYASGRTRARTPATSFVRQSGDGGATVGNRPMFSDRQRTTNWTSGETTSGYGCRRSSSYLPVHGQSPLRIAPLQHSLTVQKIEM